MERKNTGREWAILLETNHLPSQLGPVVFSEQWMLQHVNAALLRSVFGCGVTSRACQLHFINREAQAVNH